MKASESLNWKLSINLERSKNIWWIKYSTTIADNLGLMDEFVKALLRGIRLGIILWNISLKENSNKLIAPDRCLDYI